MALYLKDQFFGCAGSFSLSQSISNWGSEVPVVATEATRWFEDRAEERETCAVKVRPRASAVPGSSDELDSAMEMASGALGSGRVSEHFSGSREDMTAFSLPAGTHENGRAGDTDPTPLISSSGSSSDSERRNH
jgi:hypothetical protein